MATILVCYDTGEGQTAKVADRLADELRARGHEPTNRNSSAFTGDVVAELPRRHRSVQAPVADE